MTDNQTVEPTAYFSFAYTQKRAIKLFFKGKKETLHHIKSCSQIDNYMPSPSPLPLSLSLIQPIY